MSNSPNDDGQKIKKMMEAEYLRNSHPQNEKVYTDELKRKMEKKSTR